jgi:rhamnosyltransferase
MATLPALAEALERQRRDGPLEIVAVDSESSDGTTAFLRRFSNKVIEIPAAEFNHGLTRNLGIQQAHGELVVLMVQDVVPASDDWLSNLIAPLADPTVAGAFARQQARDDASAVTRHYVQRSVAVRDAARTATLNRAEFDALSPVDRLARCTFDNVCSCIRRSVWHEHPFRRTPIAEDIEWALEVLLAGYRLAYVAQAVVTHSHDRSARYEFARTYLLHRRLYELLELRTIPTIPTLARAVASSLALHLRCEWAARPGNRRVAGVGHAVSLAFAWPFGQYLGALSAAKGWKPIRWRTV